MFFKTSFWDRAHDIANVVPRFSGAGVQAAESLATLFLRRLVMSFRNLLPTDHVPCQAPTTSTKPKALPSLRDGHITLATRARA